MKQFILENWRLILEACCVVASLVFCLIRKKPVKVVDTVKETIVRLLPYCINRAEKAPKGEKLVACLKLLQDVLAELGIEFTDSYKAFATEQVEIILTTPQKKEV